MSKPVKDQITKELTKKFESLEGVGVINPRGINATKNNLMIFIRPKILRDDAQAAYQTDSKYNYMIDQEREYNALTMGWNYRFSSILAAFTLSQLRRLDGYTQADMIVVGFYLMFVRHPEAVLFP